MAIDATLLARARLALRQAVRQHLFDPNVNLIDFGYPEHGGEIVPGELAIRFHVHRKLSPAALERAAEAGETQPIPPTIGGFPTDVPEGSYRLHGWGWGNGGSRPAVDPRARKVDPLRGGISISNESQFGYGTLGGHVRDRQGGGHMILSNYHVLANPNSPWRRPRIYQPGRLDRGTSADAVGVFDRHAMLAHLDAAVAYLDDGREWVNEQLGLGGVTGVGTPDLGMELVKSGRRTGITFGLVTAVEGVARLRYGPTDRIIEHVLTIEPRRPFEQVSGPGDSGSWWLDRATNWVVGLHFAGANQPERALALEMQVVLDTLDVDLATEPETARPVRGWAAGWR